MDEKTKSTGVVRRIDDLGRVVIPKEIRRTLRIREGDSLEIYTMADGSVVFKKFSPMGELSDFSGKCAEILGKTIDSGVLVCDRDRVIASSNLPKEQFVGRQITTAAEKLLETRKPYVWGKSTEKIFPIDGVETAASIIVPVVVAGDLVGAVMVLADEPMQSPAHASTQLTKMAGAFLEAQVE